MTNDQGIRQCTDKSKCLLVLFLITAHYHDLIVVNTMICFTLNKYSHYAIFPVVSTSNYIKTMYLAIIKTSTQSGGLGNIGS